MVDIEVRNSRTRGKRAKKKIKKKKESRQGRILTISCLSVPRLISIQEEKEREKKKHRLGSNGSRKQREELGEA